MTNRLQNIVIFIIILMPHFSIGQNNYNDLYFAQLKGNVKTCSLTTESFDSTSFNFGLIKKVVSSYNPNGNCYYEKEWIDSDIIQKREIIFDRVNGIEKRIKKITTHAVDSTNKTLSYYHFDETGFDTSIVVCSLDSSYFMLYIHEKNNFGLRSKGTEINPKNGRINYSYEIYYSKDKIIDSIIHKNGTGKVNYTEYYKYINQNELAQIYYSDGGCTQYEYYKIDEFGNWREMYIYYVKDEKKELVKKQFRLIEYYE